MTTIKCRKCGHVFPLEEKICPICGYDIRKDKNLSARDRASLGLPSDSSLFMEHNKKIMDQWKSQTKEERLQEAWEHRNSLEIRPDQSGLPRLNIPLNAMVVLTIIMIAAICLVRIL